MATIAGRSEPLTPRAAHSLKGFVFASLMMLAFGALAYLCIELTRGSGRIAVIWIPNAIVVAMLLRWRVPDERLAIAACVLGNVLANLAVGDAPLVAGGLALANGAEILLAVLLARKWCGGDPRMDDINDLSRFVFAAGILAPTGSAMVAACVLWLNGPFGLAGMTRWAMSDSLSMLIIAPSAMVIIDAVRKRRRPTRRELVEWLLLTGFGTTVTLLVFSQTTYPLLFIIPLVVISHAFRLGTLGTAFSVLKVATIASIFTELGHGPINLLPVAAEFQLLLLEGFLASALVVGLPVAAALSTRERITRELELLAENITDAILRYDLHGLCTYASPSVTAVLGAPPSAFMGTTTDERAHRDSREDIARVQSRLLSGCSDTERFTYRRLLDDADGNPVYIEADCAVAYDNTNGEREGIIVSARDVTERVQLERKLKRATRHAENAARAKAQFLANMSHEIRTPMNGVLGFADLLCQMKLEDDAAHYAELIVSSGRSMMMLLNDILDISKIESGQLVLAYEKTDLGKLAGDCVRLHQTGAERKDVHLSLACGPDLPERVVTDPLRLRQILLNLIANAVKFTENGSVEVSVQREGERLAISVEDSGIGIDPARLEQIFDPFTQEEASTTRRFGGTGLGLSISRQLAELLGGSLSVDSMPGVGSRFTLRVPLEEVPAEAAAAKRNAAEAPAAQMRSGARVLLAEDHDVNRMLVTAMLEQLGQHVEVAHDGLEAVSKALDAAESDAPFDLVLMDVQMPGCDGYSATRMIRQGGVSQARLPIVALTANAFPEDVAAARDAGMQAHLAKPLVFEELAAALARWLPVRIVDEAPRPAVATPTPGQTHSKEILARWNERRSEALDAVNAALRDDSLEGVRVEDLARTVHKLAGTAGMFGEEELGEKAAALERALRAGVEREVRKQLAEELVAMA
ncbi:MASE1 domain-containing protein [Qipengyuania sp. 1NDH17]|uniref:histidine kinase n=1 Tax=Qipengyuania polymorpha TaxID=2867234 RepID=A0ABS7IXK8_9SPHN|nr:ATP-binding protein [Qipengyuania polymorpha]MBX7458298.1 MASE1 domain-containing protein [Qipengyuania polymorpha]